VSIPTVLTVAGSDPSGGAGIQADLKTFGALGAYGCAVLTSLTAQSTRGVSAVHPVPAAFVAQQVTTLVEDVRVEATKVGMLGTGEVARTVAGLCREGVLPRVVLDPVMVSTAGSRLLEQDAVDAVRGMLADVCLVTPNLAEAGVLLGVDPAETVPEMHHQARALCALGAPRVLLKGGHLGEDAVAVDVWATGEGTVELRGDRVRTRNTHGTGCTLSSAVTALVPQRPTWLGAAQDAKAWLAGALARADELDIGHGPGPVHHFHALWPR
jgi:hydroxymethylpyrimidine/phosphomethylpyrimidine kinase